MLENGGPYCAPSHSPRCSQVPMSDILAIRGHLRAAPNTTGNIVAGFRLSASVTRLVPVADGDPATIPILCSGGGIADAQGAFAFDLGGDGEPRDPVTIVVSTP